MMCLWSSKVLPEEEDFSEERPPFMMPKPPHNLNLVVKQDFNLHNLNTNFKITDNFVEMVRRTPGVEVLVPISAYRMVVGVAKAYNPDYVVRKVKASWPDRLNDTLGYDKFAGLPEPVRDMIEDTALLHHKSHFKCAYVFPHGKMEFFASPTADSVFAAKTSLFSMSRREYGGHFVIQTNGLMKDSFTEPDELEDFI